MTVARLVLCFSCRDSAFVSDNRCGERMKWPEEVITLYVMYRKSRKSMTRSKSSAPPPPPPAASVSSPLPFPHVDIELRFSFFECYSSYLS